MTFSLWIVNKLFAWTASPLLLVVWRMLQTSARCLLSGWQLFRKEKHSYLFKGHSNNFLCGTNLFTDCSS